MNLKNILAIMVLTSIFFVFILVFRNMSGSDNNPIETLTVTKNEEVQDVSGFFDKAKNETKTTITPLPNNKPKCDIGGNLVDEGTVVDGVTCVVN